MSPKNKTVCRNEFIMKMKMVMEKRKHKKETDLDVDIKTNIEQTARLGKKMSLCNKEHLSNISGSISKKLSNNEAELRKSHWSCSVKKVFLKIS